VRGPLGCLFAGAYAPGRALLNLMPSRPFLPQAAVRPWTLLPKKSPDLKFQSASNSFDVIRAAIFAIAAVQHSWRDFSHSTIELRNAPIRAAKKLDAGDCRDQKRKNGGGSDESARARQRIFARQTRRYRIWRRGAFATSFFYRDLGIAAATGGQVICHLVKANPEMPPEGRQPAGIRHDCDFQIVIMMKGWARFHVRGQADAGTGR